MQNNTTEKLVKLLEPYLPKDWEWQKQGFIIDNQIIELKDSESQKAIGLPTLEEIIFLLTHTKEGKPVKEGDVPCILGDRLVCSYCKGEGCSTNGNHSQCPECQDLLLPTKAQAFITSYENLTLATSDFKAFMVLLIEELEGEIK